MPSTLAATAIATALAFAGQGAPPAGSAPARTPSDAERSATAPREPDSPPPGDKADQTLWQAAYDMNAELLVGQHVAARLAQGAKGSGYLERLPELAKSGAIPRARADALASRLQEKWQANVDLVQGPWPVSKVRGCAYELLDFETAMPAGPGAAAQRGDARKALQECMERARLVLGALQKANEEFQSALADVERELKALPATREPSRPSGG